MKPEKPKSPRQELEASLTALLLGELPPDKAVALRELMAKDAEFARLYARLEQTIGLVHETAAVPSEQTAPLKLSNKRREQLLQHFKTIAPKEFANSKRMQIRAREWAIAAGIVAFIGVGAWLVFNQEGHAFRSSMSQVDVLRSGRETTVTIARDMAKAAPASGVSSVAYQTTARLATEQGLDMAQNKMVATPPAASLSDQTADHFSINGSLAEPSPNLASLSLGGGGGDMGRASQTIFDHEPAQQAGGTALVASAGKPSAKQIVLPTPKDYTINDAVSPPTFQPAKNYASYDKTMAAPVIVNPDTKRTPANNSLGVGPQNDEMLRREAGGLAWDDTMHSKQSNDGLAETVQQMNRAKVQQAVRNNSENKPGDKVPVIDPATGLPVAGAYATGAIDPATGFPIPVESAPKEMVPLETRILRVSTNVFGDGLASMTGVPAESFGNPAATGGGTGGGGGGGGIGVRAVTRTNDMSSLQANVHRFYQSLGVDLSPQSGRSVFYNDREGTILARGTPQELDTISAATEALNQQPPQVNIRAKFAEITNNEQKALGFDYYLGNQLMHAQGGTAPSNAAGSTLQSAGEKLVEVAKEGKDASGSNIYLGKELAKADVKFGTWSLETGQPAARPGGTKKEEEKLKQVDEMRDGATIAGRAATPSLGFSLFGPKETPPPSGVPVDSQGVPLLGDLPTLGQTFKGGELKSEQARGEAVSPPGDLALARGTTGTRERDAALLFEMGRLDEAEALFKQAAKEDPNNRATDYYLNLIKDNRYRKTQNGKELVTRQTMVDVEKERLNPPPSRELSPAQNLNVDTYAVQPGAKVRGDVVVVGGLAATNLSGYVDTDKDWNFGTGTPNRAWFGGAGATNMATTPGLLKSPSDFFSLEELGYVNGTASGTINSPLFAGAPPISKSFADRLQLAGTNTASYDRYNFYRNLQQLGAEGDKETKLALSYSDVQDDDRKAADKSSAAETKKTNVPVPSEFVSEVIPFKYAKASEIASALNSLSTGSGGATVGGGTTGTTTRSTGGFGRTGTGANYGSPSTPEANVTSATGDSFTNRLRGIINRAGSTGEIVVLGQNKMIADERSNSLLLYASREDMKTIKEAIAKLDVEPAQVTDPRVAAKPTTSPQLHASYKMTDASPNPEAPTMPTMLMSAETLRKLEGMRIELEAQVMHQETQLDALKKMPREKLVASLPTATPDTHLNSLLEQKTYAEQALILKQRELGEASPEVAKLRSQVGDLNSKIDQQADGILANLDGRVAATKEQLSKLRVEVEKAKTNDLADAKKTEPYWEAKRKLDELQQVSQVLAMKIASENIEASLPKSTMVEIMDDAVPAQAKKTDVWDRIRGKGKYESQARVKVERDQSDISFMQDPRTGGTPYDPYFIQNEFETIQSDKVLGKVVEGYNLQKEWAKGGQTLSTNQAIAILKQKLDLKPERNSSFVDIGIKSDKPAEAAELANAVARAYQAYRLEIRKELSLGSIKGLEQRWNEQQAKIQEAQKQVDKLGEAAVINQAKAAASQPAASQQVDAAPSKSVVPLPVPQPEIQTRENAFSTFSLNVSDVAFKLAAGSLEKGQMPEPGGIRSEEFINAFDYRDPEAPAGVPVAFAWERARYPYAQNRDLLRFSIKTAAQGRQAGRPLNLVLLMDNSGSMERADRIAIIRQALKVLASQLQPQDKLSVITFARTAQLRVDGVAGNQAAQVAEDIGGLTPEGGTNIEEAMSLAYQTALRHYLANGINRVVLLTDGAANLGNVEPETLKQKVEANRKQGVALDCFGIGWEGFNDDLLETLSRNGDGRYGFINSPEEAATEFAGQLAGALNVAASDVKVQVEFNPARVTAYRQIGYAKHQLTKEQFRDNTVDAAEIAAQEAGNALYVIELNPAGQGPLATVRVRFKVPGTSDYREHEWTVPFNGNAVALEQSSPAMRLAATASAFSEWLATSPYATEVTPDTLLSYLSGVPEVYGVDGRPKKLELMIRQAKSLAGK